MSTFTSIEAFILQQQANGKAFEYACADAIVRLLQARRAEAGLLQTEASSTAARRFSELSALNKNFYTLAAVSGVRLLERCEPNLRTSAAGERFIVSIQADAEGEAGDVRDVLIGKDKNWQVGLSIKHNNDAVKHSRLSGALDFGKVWIGRACDPEYFRSIKSAFDELESLAHIGAHWDSLGLNTEDKARRFYRPVLEAFLAQLERFAARHREAPAAVFRYLLGRQDFYKLIASTAMQITTLEIFCFNGLLGQRAGALKPEVSIKSLPQPSKIIAAHFKPASDNTVLIRFDEGWTLSLRLHNASSRVEPSLKFDARLTARPASLLKLVQHWEA